VLSLLGLSIQPPDSSTDKMIADAMPYLKLNTKQVAIPSLLLISIVLAVSFLGDGLHDALAAERQFYLQPGLPHSRDHSEVRNARNDRGTSWLLLRRGVGYEALEHEGSAVLHRERHTRSKVNPTRANRSTDWCRASA
jgi:hypothetical protein